MSKKNSIKRRAKKTTKKNDHLTNKDKKIFFARFSFIISSFVVIILGLLLYSNTFHVPFYFDDFDSIVYNPYIKHLQNFSIIPSFYEGTHARFLSLLSFALNFHFNALSVSGYHVVNILIHLVNSLLVMLLVSITLNTPVLAEKFSKSEKKIFILMTGLLFVSHPIQTQAVTYIVQRMTILAALFYLSALNLYVRARLAFENSLTEVKKKHIVTVFLLILTLIAAVLALWSKEIAATLPVIIIIYELLFLRDANNRINWKIVIFITALFSILVLFILFYIGLPVETEKIPRGIYLLTQISVVVTYIRLLFLPFNQNLDYDFPLTTSLFNTGTIIDLMIILGLIVIAIKLAKKYQLISFSILWFFVTLSVTSSVLPIRDVIVEHRLYLPMFGFSLFAVTAVFSIFRKNTNGMYLFFSIIIVIYSISAYQRNELWTNPVSMWTDVIRKSPNKLRPYFSRGSYFLQHNQVDYAIYDFKKVISLNKNYYKAYDNLGVAYQLKKEFKLAIQFHDEAIKINPQFAAAYGNRASALIELGDYSKSIDDLKKAIGLYSNYTDAYYNLGYVYYMVGEYENSIKYFLTALTLNPTYMEAHNYLAKNYYAIGDYEDAWKQIDVLQKNGVKLDKKFIEKLTYKLNRNVK